MNKEFLTKAVILVLVFVSMLAVTTVTSVRAQAECDFCYQEALDMCGITHPSQNSVVPTKQCRFENTALYCFASA